MVKKLITKDALISLKRGQFLSTKFKFWFKFLKFNIPQIIVDQDLGSINKPNKGQVAL